MNIKRARTGNVVIRSLVSTQIACVLTTIAPQLVNTLNGLIVSTFLGVDCFKAISAFNPITGMILLMTSTACLGPSIQAGKAYGELNQRTANRLFTLAGIITAAISIISALVIFFFRREISGIIAPDSSIADNLSSFIKFIPLYLILNAGASLLNAFVSAAGEVKKVTAAVIVSGIVNVISIFGLIRFFHSGTEAAGIALCLSAAANILFLIPTIPNGHFPFRLVSPHLEFLKIIKQNILVWISANSNSLATAFIQFTLNIIILHFLPSDGLFAWGICQIALSLIAFSSAGLSDAYLYVDSYLTGEGDSTGRLKTAKSYLLETVALMFLMALVFTFLTDSIAMAFGASSPELADSVRTPLICVAWYAAFNEIFCTFGTFSIQRRPMIKLGYDFVLGITVPALAFVFALLSGGNHLWFGLPSTAIVLAAYVAIVSGICCHRDRNLIPYFLFNKVGDVVNLDISVNYSLDNFQEDMTRIRKFLAICEVDDILAGKIELCCEELIQNMPAKKAKGGTFDLRLSDLEDSMSIVVKNVGVPLSPVIDNDIVNDFREKGRIPDEKEISLLCIRQCGSEIVYRYVYGMNVAYLQFDKHPAQPQQSS